MALITETEYRNWKEVLDIDVLLQKVREWNGENPARQYMKKLIAISLAKNYPGACVTTKDYSYTEKSLSIIKTYANTVIRSKTGNGASDITYFFMNKIWKDKPAGQIGYQTLLANMGKMKYCDEPRLLEKPYETLRLIDKFKVNDSQTFEKESKTHKSLHAYLTEGMKLEKERRRKSGEDEQTLTYLAATPWTRLTVNRLINRLPRRGKEVTRALTKAFKWNSLYAAGTLIGWLRASGTGAWTNYLEETGYEKRILRTGRDVHPNHWNKEGYLPNYDGIAASLAEHRKEFITGADLKKILEFDKNINPNTLDEEDESWGATGTEEEPDLALNEFEGENVKMIADMLGILYKKNPKSITLRTYRYFVQGNMPEDGARNTEQQVPKTGVSPKSRSDDEAPGISTGKEGNRNKRTSDETKDNNQLELSSTNIEITDGSREAGAQFTLGPLTNAKKNEIKDRQLECYLHLEEKCTFIDLLKALINDFEFEEKDLLELSAKKIKGRKGMN